MTPRERMAVAMRLGTPDRVPVMCQLALGHYFLHAGLDRVDVWHSTEAFAEALVRLQRRYGFDGILVNLPGRDPEWRRQVERLEERDGERVITWTNGWYTMAPPDDNPHVYQPDGSATSRTSRRSTRIASFYVEPHDLSASRTPTRGGSGAIRRPRAGLLPAVALRHDARGCWTRGRPTSSVHGEVFSPFSQLMELLGLRGRR